MRDDCYKKGIVLGIIVLFVGVGVYPAVASAPIKTSNILQNEELESLVITDTSDSEEDCNCQPVSKLHFLRFHMLLVKLKTLVNRLVVYNNLFFLLSKHNPEFAEIHQEMSGKISALAELNEKLKIDSPLWDFPIICAILESIFIPFEELSVYYGLLSDYYEDKNLILYIIYMALSALFGVPTFIIFQIGLRFDCWEWPP